MISKLGIVRGDLQMILLNIESLKNHPHKHDLILKNMKNQAENALAHSEDIFNQLTKETGNE